MINIEKLLMSLAKKRPVFHSEADFQHALAWEIHSVHPNYKLRLEIRPNNSEDREYLDIQIESGSRKCLIELKYKTRKWNGVFDGEDFSLAGHSAHDCGRYDFIKDVERLEKFSKSHDAPEYYAILLTNDSAYWRETRVGDPCDQSFRVHEGREFIPNKKLSWKIPGTSEGTMRGRDNNLKLEKQYEPCHWRDFSTVDSEAFRYLLIKPL